MEVAAVNSIEIVLFACNPSGLQQHAWWSCWSFDELPIYWMSSVVPEACELQLMYLQALIRPMGRCLAGQVALACNVIPERSTSSSFTWLSLHFQLSGGFLSISLQLSLGRWAVVQVWGPLCACNLCRVTLSAALWHMYWNLIKMAVSLFLSS